jgi:COP9 signalosome complex subunit 4
MPHAPSCLHLPAFSTYPVPYKMRNYVKIAQLYLEEGDSVEAEAYVNRASLLQNQIDDKELYILYKVRARVCIMCACAHAHAGAVRARARLPSQIRRGGAALLRPLIASWHCRHRTRCATFAGHTYRCAEHARSQAVTCAVLAPAGQPRARILATLYKDERCHTLTSFAILQVRSSGRTGVRTVRCLCRRCILTA